MLVLYKLNYLQCNLKNKAWHFLIGRIVNSVRANLIRIRDDVKRYQDKSTDAGKKFLK